MIATSEKSVAFLKERLSSAVSRTIHQLIADLDDNDFLVRENASRELSYQREAIEPALRKALQNTSSAEVRKRLRRILDGSEPQICSPKLLQQLRALRILEETTVPEAKQLLESLANGATEARLTQEAKASLERLAKRQAAGP
jgi:hypothetical protein